MAVIIVNRLKVIDIDHQAAQRAVVAHRQIHLRMQRFLKMMAVSQPGQRIKQRFFQQSIAQTLVG